eukprot:TRINITY_DN3560_c0_g1_i1.p1 TRINITY_DN3560_c0_g1~~TRINITY_DN3560_c0_g1_i1.p1  ORF type:complete len:167 (-),score=45.29 TRINITY_DN3560_c0_g1_i1:130-630(-)
MCIRDSPWYAEVLHQMIVAKACKNHPVAPPVGDKETNDSLLQARLRDCPQFKETKMVTYKNVRFLVGDRKLGQQISVSVSDHKYTKMRDMALADLKRNPRTRDGKSKVEVVERMEQRIKQGWHEDTYSDGVHVGSDQVYRVIIERRDRYTTAVSYTHLTLPTIYSV